MNRNPSDQDLYDYWIYTSSKFGCADPVGFARAVLAVWGGHPFMPVPLSNGLPESRFCDTNEMCWWYDSTQMWVYDTYQGNYTHWLPYYLLPNPTSNTPGK